MRPFHFDISPTDRDQDTAVEGMLVLVDLGQGDRKWAVLANPPRLDFCVMPSVSPEREPCHHLKS